MRRIKVVYSIDGLQYEITAESFMELDSIYEAIERNNGEVISEDIWEVEE